MGKIREGFPKPSWRVRRRIIVAALIFCAMEIIYLTVCGEDTRLHESIANGMIMLAASVIGSYVFGAVWDDINNHPKNREYEEVRRDDYPTE